MNSVGLNERSIIQDIRNQEAEEIALTKLSLVVFQLCRNTSNAGRGIHARADHTMMLSSGYPRLATSYEMTIMVSVASTHRMRAFSIPLLSLVFAGLLGACSGGEEPPPLTGPRPVKTLVVAGADGEGAGVRQFPARIDAMNKAELAFRVPGTIAELPVKEGDQVEPGQLLAALDPTDYDITLKDAQASFERARKDFERATELEKDGFISRTDFDAKEAEFKNAEAGLARAQQDLDYTKLTASFAGTVAARYVQRFEEVQAKQPVLALHDTGVLEVKIDVPETVILGLRPSQTGRMEPGRVPVFAELDSRPGERFDLTLSEIGTRADPQTQTFEVTFTMPAPKAFRVLPGMTATVTADLSGVAAAAPVQLLPASAVTADEALGPFVWVVDETNMTVRRNPVQVGALRGGLIEIVGGLEPGTRVVVAGVGQLAEGMKVRLLPEREEAAPRPEEAPTQ
ncbi:RND family efflux transporter, MFP subunit [Thiorhodovibrio frisius]|uniref:RND family efflux transporter, MFP subunit n=2 Tax=Thiorhodovibrio frisius TaxID=631362 RepID=H8YW67_9GAMM|nr:RND family efflux transporter, MFP subunit [Thiorhodovibrio frisius]WPL23232.1 Multidrug transporter MdtA [Thiorhodovibrio frisius]